MILLLISLSFKWEGKGEEYVKKGRRNISG